MNTEPFVIGSNVQLPSTGTWPAAAHRFDADSVHAILAARAAQRPLLLRGDPGTGKSQLARAAAVVLRRALVSTVVQGRSEAQDLQWRFDAVARLGEAQALGAAGTGNVEEVLNPERFLSPGPLWWVFDWESAERQHGACRYPGPRPQHPPGWSPADGAVLLIDEIDKADADLPNGLLETLGNGAFSVPYRDRPVGIGKGWEPPLVIVTTNAERELPPAFLRRCLVLPLRVPGQRDAFFTWLFERAAAHSNSRGEARLDYDQDVWDKAADQLWHDRQVAKAQGVSRPGLAEFLDLLRALTRLAPGNRARQLELLGLIAGFTFSKHPQEEE